MIYKSSESYFNLNNFRSIDTGSIFSAGDKVKIINLNTTIYNNQYGIVEAVPGQYISSPKHYIVRLNSVRLLIKEENLRSGLN